MEGLFIMFRINRRHLIVGFLFTGCLVAVASFQGKLATSTACGAEDETTVEVSLAAEHAPQGLKTGDKVDLMRVDGKAVSRTGKVSYTTVILAQELEVAAVTRVDKPKSPEEAIKVELRVNQDQAATIERTKAQRVTTVVTTSDGGRKTEKRPVTLRLELAESDKP